MLVLSVAQPFATLIARGLMPFVPRPGMAPKLGRAAVHAVAAAPSHAFFKFAEKHARLARTFRKQGWTSREHLLALPRGAIVGTVEIRAVRIVREVLLDPARADGSPDERIDVTAAGGDGRHDPDAFVMPVWTDDYLWMLANAIEFEPITGVTGSKGLWELSAKHARLVAGAERGLREVALRAAAAQRNELKMQRTRRRARERLDQVEVQRKAQEAKRIRDAARERAVLENDLQWFAEDALERGFQRVIARYLARYPLRTGDGPTQVRIMGPLPQSLFPDETWVTLVEFERRLRVHYRKVLRAKTTPRPAHNPFWDLPWHLPRLARVVEIGAAAGVHVEPKRRSRRKKDGRKSATTDGKTTAKPPQRDRPTLLDGEPEVQVQREDPHDPPDPREYGGFGE